MSLGPDLLVPRLLAELDTSEGLPADFLSEMVARFEKEDDNALGQVGLFIETDRAMGDVVK